MSQKMSTLHDLTFILATLLYPSLDINVGQAKGKVVYPTLPQLKV